MYTNARASAPAASEASAALCLLCQMYKKFKYCINHLHTVHNNMNAWDCFIGRPAN
jgi:hypothetical protein